MQRTLFLVVGFLFAGVGLLSILLTLVGVQFSFLAWMNNLGPLLSFVLKIVLTITGFVLLVLSQTDFSGQDEGNY